MLKRKTSQQGSALMLVVIIVLILSGISGAYLTISWWNQRRAQQDESAAQAVYLAESAAAKIIAELNASGNSLTPKTWAINKGLTTNRAAMMGGFYWVPEENIVDFGDRNVVGTTNLDPDYWSFQVAAKFNGVVRRLDVLVSHKAGGVFWNAIFAGNSSGDDTYSLDLSGPAGANGSTPNVDIIRGDIYSANDIKGTNYAQLKDEKGTGEGKVVHKGDNLSDTTVPANYQQDEQESLEIKKDQGSTGKMNVAEANAKENFPNLKRDANGVVWVDVEAQFDPSKNPAAVPDHPWTANGSRATDILDVKNPAHFMRKNPTSANSATRNRTASYEMSVNPTTIGRNDYYIEDPIVLDNNGNLIGNQEIEPSQSGQAVNGNTGASMLNIYPESNKAVYYIDGNLRVSNEDMMSYQWRSQNAGDIKMTFVVKGNVSLTDNLLYPKWESATDVVAIIAITDDKWTNSIPGQFGDYNAAGTVTPNGVSVKSFVDAYNTRANASGGKMLPLTLPADAARASQEYNKIYGSGNVFYGDPGSGTVEHFEAFMYAENNFYATNLDSTKSSGGTNKVEIYGNMTAGNKVSMDRFSSRAGYNGYIPLRVTFDPAIRNGNPPPWIPDTPSKDGIDWHINSWKQSAVTAEFDNKLGK